MTAESHGARLATGQAGATKKRTYCASTDPLHKEKYMTKRILIALLACLGLMYTTAGPAAAVTVGAGAGTGLEFPVEDPLGFCGPPTAGFHMLSAQFVLNHTGAYVNDTNTVVYQGPSKVTIDIGSHLAAPQGAAPGNCGGPVIVPAQIPITSVSITGSTPGGLLGGAGSVNCSSINNGNFLRVGEVAVFTFDVSCTLDGNVAGGVANNITVTHAVEGTMTPCVLNPLLGFPTNPVCDTRPDGQSAGSHLETAYEAV